VANQVPTYFVTQFTDQVEYLAQQMDSRFWELSSQKDYQGSGAVATEQVGATYFTPVTGRGQPVQITDTPAGRRWIYPNKAVCNDFVDTFEELEMAIAPRGWIAGAQVAASNRYKDDVWLANFFGAAQTLNTSTTGNAPSTAVTFPTTQIVNSYVGTSGTTTATGMNVPKLRAARKLFLAAEVDLKSDPAAVGMNAVQLDNMLNQAQAISLDFQDKPVLVEGQITRFMGFEFVHSERIPKLGADSAGSAGGTTYTQNPCWVRSGMRSGTWIAMKTEMFQRDDLTARPYQVSSWLMIGATRLQEVKCVQINSTEA
jgi:hypothetical protein